MIAEIGQNLLQFLHAVITLNKQFVSTALRVCCEAWKGTIIILHACSHGISQLVYCLLDIGQEVLQIIQYFLAVCSTLAVVVLQIVSVLLTGLENIGWFIAGVIVTILRYGCDTVSGVLQYCGVASLETRQYIHSGVLSLKTYVSDRMDCFLEGIIVCAKLGIKQLAALLHYTRNSVLNACESLQDKCCVLLENVSTTGLSVYKSIRKDITLEIYMWCAGLLCLASILLGVINYLSRRGLTFPSFLTSQPNRTLQFHNEREYELFNFSDEEHEDNEDEEEEEEEQEITEESEESEDTEDTDSVEEYEVATSDEEESDEENDENLVVQLPELNDNHHTHRCRATPFNDRSNREMSPEALEKILERERDRRACVVCRDALKCVLVLPCRHMCLCIHCARYLVSQRIRQRICPLCRTRIHTVMNVYV